MPTWTGQTWKVLGRLLGAACLLLFYHFALTAVVTKSPTNDEPAHILRGVMLQQGEDLRFQTGHTPLSHRLISWSVALESQVPPLTTLDAWTGGERLEIASELVWKSGVSVERLLFLARLPVVWLALWLGALVMTWTRAWLGQAGMAVAAVLYAGAPNLIASAALATTDLTAAATYFATGYAWWRYWRSRLHTWWLATGIFLGLALASKLTAVLLLPVLALLALLACRTRRDWRHAALSWLGLLPVAFATLWIVYGFELGRAQGFPFLIPAASYLSSWQAVLAHVDRGHQAYLLGELSGDGWWYYFPVAFLIKTPVATLLLTLLGGAVVAWRRELWRTAVFLVLSVLALFAAAMLSLLNIGYRHILPATPFLLVLAGASALPLRRRWATSALLAVLLGGYLLAAVGQQPHFLAYFNVLAGGSARGYRYLGDSNLDWGQDLKLLAETVTRQGGTWRISYAGTGDPGYYGLDPEKIIEAGGDPGTFAPANPAAGRYAISANHLQGVLADADRFDWFRRRDPDQSLGGSILIYEVQQQQDGRWIAHCLDPGPLLEPATAEALVGKNGLRHLWFDCRQSWALPAGNGPGWYVLPQADTWWFIRHLANAAAEDLQLVYRHRASAGAPSYDIHYWPGTAEAPLAMEEAQAQFADGQPLALPYDAGGVAELQGYSTDGEEWVTAWAVLEKPAQPLSLRAHLYTASGGAPLVGDGLGYSSEQWQPGDLLLQRHTFPGAEEPSSMETGLYNYLSSEVLGQALRLPLP